MLSSKFGGKKEEIMEGRLNFQTLLFYFIT